MQQEHKQNTLTVAGQKNEPRTIRKLVENWHNWLISYADKRVALIGAGEHTLLLSQLLGKEFDKMPIVKILDSHPTKDTLLGIPIATFEEGELDNIDFVIISSQRFEDEIYETLLTILDENKIGRLYNLSTENIFEDIYKQNAWGSEKSISGTGSEESQVALIKSSLPKLLKRLDTKVFLDLPCGDFNWMRDIDFEGISYIGGDIVKELIDDNNRHYKAANFNFQHLDLMRSTLPNSDVIFCRDCLVHLSFEDIHKAISNIMLSKARYLITTCFVDRQDNIDIKTGGWRPLNLLKAPFNFPPPIEIVIEGCTESNNNYQDKALCVWDISDLTNVILE
jgi:SAM-dependent methyltransferase